MNLGVAVSGRLSRSGYYTPINQNISRSLYGANASLRLGKEFNNPSFNLGWSNTEYRFKNGFIQSDNIFTILFRLRQLASPFNPPTSERLTTEEAELIK